MIDQNLDQNVTKIISKDMIPFNINKHKSLILQHFLIRFEGI